MFARSTPARLMCTAEGTAGDAPPEGLSKSALKKLKKQQEQAARKAEKKAQKAAAAEAEVATAEADSAEEPPASYSFGDDGVLMSDTSVLASPRTYTPVRTLGAEGGAAVGEEVWVRGRLFRLRAKGNQCFLVVRSGGFFTVQACFFKDKETPRQSKEMLSWLSELTAESIIDVRGELVSAQVQSCSQGNVELAIREVRLVSASLPQLPFELEDASRSEEEVTASEATERPFARIGQELRLNNRWVDLRVPANLAIMRCQSQVCTLFREALLAEGFVEIHTPKLIAGESEGGAGVFRTDYFGQSACLAQSPQLYKQMAIASDMGRVFEVAPVFRAENSNTRRHLCEFVGLDLEMEFAQHYNEVIGVLHTMFVHLFTGLEERCADELAAIRTQYPDGRDPPRFSEKPTVVHWEQAMEMLREAGEEAPGLDDLNTQQERTLGRLVAEQLGTDFYFLDRFPSAVRPFYTMPCPDDARYSNSYDVFLRGEEICSGAQRVHDPAMLEKAIAAKGLPLEPLQAYIDSMRYGMPPHGGGGIGLERLVFLYLNLDNVRKASMFPRDPRRCSP
eukprot:Transcript_11050.p1 GENE.Transcript_11050~~Transcript_11050.p1  ORF type:complete len:602 (+),score=274.84 Transcript_11050:115-1806(+)